VLVEFVCLETYLVASLLKKKNRLPEMMIQMNHLMEDEGRRRSAGANKRGTRKLRHDIGTTMGQLEFFTGDRDGFVEICVQAYASTPTTPRRFGFHVLKVSLETYEAEHDTERAKQIRMSQQDQMDTLLKVETSRITTELERFIKRIQDISGNAAASKDRQASFVQTSIALKRAVRGYPIFRICILLIAGYLQASHVIRYMRSRHIY
jgi:hypothetical protein